MDLSSLNDRQLAAVTAPLGPVLVLAGAGSGKTRVLTFRIAYLIEQGLVAPENILALTFTNKAAKEMQTRMLKLLGAGAKSGRSAMAGMPNMGTFHSIGARLLRKEIAVLGYGRDFSIFDAQDQLRVLREICDELQIGKKFPPTVFRGVISKAKNVLQTPGEFNLGYDPAFHDMAVRVYTAYQNFLYEQNALDFDDLLMLPIRLFQAFPKILEKYQRIFGYILVDEYQDTNQAQYMFLHLLSLHHKNLFVVGDDAQSIYGFRGSDIANILNFEKDYPETQVIKLEQNYRSTKNILAVAQNVIELNREQKPKKLWTDNDAGKRIWVEEVGDGREEALFIARQIIKQVSGDAESDGELEYESEPEPETTTFSILDQFLKKPGYGDGFSGRTGSGRISGWGMPQMPPEATGLNNYAVLYRTNAQSRELEEVFIQCGIPYQIVGGVKFYERKEIKDMLAYARLILNFTDLVSLKRVVNVPARGVGEKSYSIIKTFVADYRRANPRDAEVSDLDQFLAALQEIGLPPKQKQGVLDFYSIISAAQNLPSHATISDALRLILKLTKMEDWLRDGTDAGEARVENIQELFNVAIKFENQPWREGLTAFLEEVALITDLDQVEDEKDAVTLMTLHSAKGLEFDTVFFVGLEEGLLPHSQSMLDPAQLAEEIRLAYVGLTRARKQLYLIYARARRVFGSLQVNAPSRILRALPQEALDIHAPSSSFIDTGLRYEASDF
jgi:DNA helicase-2/ATP-dependent DNA helicase PcrA